jgi:uncharacterized peroxidase-related enzyme
MAGGKSERKSIMDERTKKSTGGKRASAAPDRKASREPVTALNLPRAELSPGMEAYFKKCDEKIGFVPNVLEAYAFDMAKLEAFVPMYNDLMLAPSGLTKLEREMIAVAVSSQNHCYYCVVAHGAAVRALSANPELGEQIAINYRAAALDPRQRGMLDFAVKLTISPWAVDEEDRARLRALGFTDRDIWDISAVAAFFNMSNRLASATDMRPNAEYHSQAR